MNISQHQTKVLQFKRGLGSSIAQASTRSSTCQGPCARSIVRNGKETNGPRLLSTILSPTVEWRGNSIIARQRRLPAGPRRLTVEAATSDTYWVTVAQAVGVAVLTAGSGVVGGLLLRYRLKKEAKEDVKRVLDEYQRENRPLPTTFEEIQSRMQGVNVARVRNRPVRRADVDAPPSAAASAQEEDAKKDEVSVL